MEHVEDPRPESTPLQSASEKRPYEAPKVEAVRLSEEAAESLT
jgi:hypothetical protein